MSNMKLHSTNWQDGMLISQRHLKDQETFLEELVRWYAQAPGDWFGLIKKPGDPEESLALDASGGGGRLKVRITRCCAMTSGGHYIEINEAARNTITAELASPKEKVPVFVAIDPAMKTEVGEPDPSEAVPRMPYLAARYQIHLGSAPAMPDTDFIQVAELHVAGSEVTMVEDFYPPCLTLVADQRLHQKATDLRNRLENLLSLSSRAYAAITTAGALSDESSSVQVAFKETMYQMAYLLSSMLDELIVGRNSRHPLHLVTQFKRLFRVFTTTLNLHPGLKDYLNAHFFTKQMNTEVGQFMASVEAFLMSDYNHRDLRSHLKVISDTMSTLRGIFGFLAQLKKDQLGPQAIATDSLTYRGKTYKAAETVGHRVEEMGELCYLIMDFSTPVPVKDIVSLISKDMFTVPEWNNMQVRVGLNEARGLGETDPVDVDSTTYGDKVALHPEDMLTSPGVSQITLIFRGARDTSKLKVMTKNDLVLYHVG